jgi:hypothetical protein
MISRGPCRRLIANENNRASRLASLFGYKQSWGYLSDFWFVGGAKSTRGQRNSFLRFLKSLALAARRVGGDQWRFLRQHPRSVRLPVGMRVFGQPDFFVGACVSRVC